MKGKKQRAARNDVQNLRPLGIKHPRASIQKRIFRLIDHAVASPHCQAIEWRCNLNIDIQRLRSQSTDDQLVLSSVAYIAQEVLFPHNKGMLPHAARCAANQKKTSFKFKRMNENLPPGVPDCAHPAKFKPNQPMNPLAIAIEETKSVLQPLFAKPTLATKLLEKPPFR
jgi:hypothetical protein